MKSSQDTLQLLEEQTTILRRLGRVAQEYPRLAMSTGISLADIAVLVGRSERTIKRWAAEGVLPVQYAGGRWPVVTLTDLPRVIEKHRRSAR